MVLPEQLVRETREPAQLKPELENMSVLPINCIELSMKHGQIYSSNIKRFHNPRMRRRVPGNI